MNNAYSFPLPSVDPSELLSIWEQSLDLLQDELGDHAFSAYIEPLTVITSTSVSSKTEQNKASSVPQRTPDYPVNELALILQVPTKFQCQLIDRNYADKIREIVRRISGIDSFQVYFQVKEQIPTPKTETQNDPSRHNDSSSGVQPTAPLTRMVVRKRASAQQLKSKKLDSVHYQLEPNTLNPKYTFQSFVVGTNNQFCNAAACRVAEQPGESYNPLFIYGGVGLGKTHLLHSIGNAVLSKNPAARVLYISSEAFTNDLIQALRNAKMDEFKTRLRSIEVLLIDDIQFISGKERTQEEFFHTFNALYSSKRQIVLTSDKIPSEIDGIEERLQTRFAWGLTADLQAPDFETRAAILRKKALVENFHLPEEVAYLIAENISSNVRELEGALTRLHALSSLQKVPITLETALVALKPLLEPKKVTVTVEDIKKAVAQHFSLKVTEIVSKRRTKNLSFPRHLAMYLCRKHTTASYPEIGQKFGGRDHSSVIHAASVVANKVADETSAKELITEIEKRLFS
jgi:chromosomal replication initiator protein